MSERSTTQKAYQAQYEAKNLMQVKFTVNKKTEPDVAAFLESVPNRRGLLLELLRQEMERTNFIYTPEE